MFNWLEILLFKANILAIFFDNFFDVDASKSNFTDQLAMNTLEIDFQCTISGSIAKVLRMLLFCKIAIGYEQ